MPLKMEHTGITGFSAAAISFDLPLKWVSSHNVERCARGRLRPPVAVTEVPHSVLSHGT